MELKGQAKNNTYLISTISPRSEEDAKVERQRLWDILEMLPAYVVLLTPDYHVPFANKFFRERFGESHGKRCFEFLFNRTEPCETCDTYKVLKTNKPHRWEWAGPDGRSYDIFDYPFTDSDGSTLILEMGIDITEIKQAQEALKLDLNRAQAVAKTGSWRLDTRRNMLIWSDETYRIFGIPKGAPLTYETFLGTVYPDDREYVDKKWTTALQGEPYDVEHRIIVDGKVKWVRETAELEFDNEGTLVGGFGTAQDITDQKIVIEEIKKISLFPAENPSPVLRVSKEGALIYANKASEKFLKKWGIKIGSALSSSSSLWITIKEALSSNIEKELEIMLDDKVFSFLVVPIAESSYVNLYARDITARAELENVLRDMNARLEDVVNRRTNQLVAANEKLMREMTERKSTERRLRDSYAILKLISANTTLKGFLTPLVKMIQVWTKCRHIGVRILTGESELPYGAYVGFNEEFMQKEGKLCLATDECACIRAVREKFDLQDTPATTSFGSFCLNNSQQFLNGLPKKQKSRFRGVCIENGFASLAVIPVRYKDQILGAIHIADERQNMLPPETIQFIESHSLLIGEGIYKFGLLDRVLKQQQSLADSKRLSDIGILAATVAHELRNPLGVIRTAVYNVKRKAQNPLIEGNLANIEKKIMEADQIINNLLYYSRIRIPELEEVDIYNLLEECAANVTNKFFGSKVKLIKQCKNLKNVTITADPTQLKEVFVNMLTNAYEAIPDGSGKIEIIGMPDNVGKEVSITIKDSGVGIESVYLKRIHEPFFTTKSKGTGLGLTVSYYIVKLHSGSIDVESEKGKGTSFKIVLPARRQTL
ncbi:MAG: ATP-binding protein [Candidatus Omnitrophica bacterium]|nr:ATP-binding protein [Candidatus Omnitrophota bacterium]